MNNTIFAAFAAISLCAAPVSAMAQDYRATVPAFSGAALGEAFEVLGYEWEIVDSDASGSAIVRAQEPQYGLNFYVETTVCQRGACLGANILAIMPAASLDVVNDFNTNEPFVSAGLFPNGDTWVSRYMIADFGIPQGNILSNVENFVGVAYSFLSAAPSIASVSFEGEAAHTAADQLNKLVAARRHSKREISPRFSAAHSEIHGPSAQMVKYLEDNGVAANESSEDTDSKIRNFLKK